MGMCCTTDDAKPDANIDMAEPLRLTPGGDDAGAIISQQADLERHAAAGNTSATPDANQTPIANTETNANIAKKEETPSDEHQSAHAITPLLAAQSNAIDQQADVDVDIDIDGKQSANDDNDMPAAASSSTATPAEPTTDADNDNPSAEIKTEITTTTITTTTTGTPPDIADNAIAIATDRKPTTESSSQQPACDPIDIDTDTEDVKECFIEHSSNTVTINDVGDTVTFAKLDTQSQNKADDDDDEKVNDWRIALGAIRLRRSNEQTDQADDSPAKSVMYEWTVRVVSHESDDAEIRIGLTNLDVNAQPQSQQQNVNWYTSKGQSLRQQKHRKDESDVDSAASNAYSSGDEITVQVDSQQWTVQFYRNGEAMSHEKRGMVGDDLRLTVACGGACVVQLLRFKKSEFDTEEVQTTVDDEQEASKQPSPPPPQALQFESYDLSAESEILWSKCCMVYNAKMEQLYIEIICANVDVDADDGAQTHKSWAKDGDRTEWENLKNDFVNACSTINHAWDQKRIRAFVHLEDSNKDLLLDVNDGELQLLLPINDGM